MFLGTIYGLYSPAGELRYIGQTARPLTAEDVRVIRKRSADGELGSRLAREYRVSESLISKIKARSIWK